MANNLLITYWYRGTPIVYDPKQSYNVLIEQREGRITTAKSYAIDFQTYLKGIEEHPKKQETDYKSVLKLIKQNGNRPAKELASQLLEKMF